MSPITNQTLAGFERRYAQILELTTSAHQLLAELPSADLFRDRYRDIGFVKVPDVVPADALTELATDLLPIFSRIAEEVRLPHKPTPRHTLSVAVRFQRVDPLCCSPDTAEKLTRLLDSLGLLRFGSFLAARLTPLVRSVVGPVSFRRLYFYVYAEGDYISAHDDHHVGARVDVQFPVSVGTVGGVRVLSEGFLRMHYDTPGSMNILGPGVWHDVPPLLRTRPDVDPQRLNLGLRFEPDEGARPGTGQTSSG
jgi:hypothetical protein